MLILRRRTGESLLIGENIVVTVLDINEGSVRLSIDAPKSIPILRSELLQVADANRDAARSRHRPESLLHLADSNNKTPPETPPDENPPPAPAENPENS